MILTKYRYNYIAWSQVVSAPGELTIIRFLQLDIRKANSVKAMVYPITYYA